MKKYVLLLFIMFPLSVFSQEDYHDIALEAVKQIPQKMAEYRQDAENATFAEKKLTKEYQADAIKAKVMEQKIVLNQIKTENINRSNNKSPSILIFVSFSMPEKSLEAYLRDAKKIHASIVIRGLIDNSFQKTFQRIAKLVKESGGDGVELNPIWFKQFAIKKVPTVVVVADERILNSSTANSGLNTTSYDLIAGDITLSYALKMVRDKGIAKTAAQSALQELEESLYA